MSANYNDSPYLYGHWRTLWSEVGGEWGNEWLVQIDAKKCDWDLPRRWLSRSLALPDNVPEAEIHLCVVSILVGLFPTLRYPDIAVQYRLGGGFADIYCQRTVFEIKKRGNLDGKGSESLETPEAQALRYLKPLADKFSACEEYVPRCCVTDGVEWRFYYYNRHSDRLLTDEMLRLSNSISPSWLGTRYPGRSYEVDEIGLLYKLHSFVSGKEWGEFISWHWGRISQRNYC